MNSTIHSDRRAVLRGRPSSPVGLKHGDDVVRLKGCPDCDGRGYYLIQPFATGGSNGAGGLRNMCQCQTCADSKAYFMAYGELPPSVVADMERAAAKKEAQLNHGKAAKDAP